MDTLFLGMTGNVLAVLGAATAFMIAGIGTSIGMGRAGQAGSGVLTEDPGKFGTVMVLQATNSTQAIYGFVVMFLILAKVGSDPLSTQDGLMLFVASLPIALVGLVSALLQGNITVACMQMIAKRADGLGRAVILILMVEMFAIIALIVSILIIGKV